MLGISKSSYYAKPTKQSTRDKDAIVQLAAVHEQHPFYGVRRMAIHLGWSEKKTRRIRTKAGIVVPTTAKRHKYPRSAKAEIDAPQNILHTYARFKDDTRPQDGMSYTDMTSAEAWAQDFTFIRHDNAFCYLAIVMSLTTREVVGWRLGTNHTSRLTHSALSDALSKHQSPAILHSDQGSECLSYIHQDLCSKMEIQLSVSNKSSSWQNGFMERWFGNFKKEFGRTSKHETLEHLHEAIALYIHYYNTKRINLALKTTPAAYAASLQSRDKVSGKGRA